MEATLGSTLGAARAPEAGSERAASLLTRARDGQPADRARGAAAAAADASWGAELDENGSKDRRADGPPPSPPPPLVLSGHAASPTPY
jgi:hypothetical protein